MSSLACLLQLSSSEAMIDTVRSSSSAAADSSFLFTCRAQNHGSEETQV